MIHPDKLEEFFYYLPNWDFLVVKEERVGDSQDKIFVPLYRDSCVPKRYHGFLSRPVFLSNRKEMAAPS